jgi:hypothetical protein
LPAARGRATPRHHYEIITPKSFPVLSVSLAHQALQAIAIDRPGCNLLADYDAQTGAAQGVATREHTEVPPTRNRFLAKRGDVVGPP